MRIERVILDYGHGGMIDGDYQTAGKQYHFTSPEEFSFYEGVFNRGVASKLATLLLNAGIEVYDAVEGAFMTEHLPANALEQTDVPLSTRVRNANRANKAGKTLYLSIHSNALGTSSTGPSMNVRGASVFVYRNYGVTGELAATMLSEYTNNTQLRARKIVENKRFYVLRKTSMPAVLTENGFFVNIDDAKYLSSECGQWDIARAHMNMISRFTSS
jgi:N-acetylmuramoyl-L-alanine amidase